MACCDPVLALYLASRRKAAAAAEDPREGEAVGCKVVEATCGAAALLAANNEDDVVNHEEAALFLRADFSRLLKYFCSETSSLDDTTPDGATL